MSSSLASVTGLGAITAFGRGAGKVWKNASSGQSSIHEGFGWIPESHRTSVKSEVLATYGLRAPRIAESPALALALAAIQEAMEEAGWDELGPEDGLLIGTTTGQANYWEPSTLSFLKDGSHVDEFAHRHPGNPLGILAHDLRQCLALTGPTQTIASACCASTQAIAIASHWIASGKVKRCLVGGVELICDLTRTGFQSLQLVSHEPCRPFDRDRQGINLSEAVVFLCLESPRPSSYASLRGFGSASDASHMTAPHPEGDGCRRAMQNALAMAKLTPEQVDWVHAHGTGSRHNDLAESKAIRTVFRAPPPVSSTKAVHGHALGASGALEALLVCQSFKEGKILANWGMRNQDPEIALTIPTETQNKPIQFVLKNTLAFGGINASLLFSRSP